MVEVLFGNLQAAWKALAWLARVNKQLCKAVESSGSAYTEVDGSRVLVSADDKELLSVFVAPVRSARLLVALNLSGLERVRGAALCELFRGPTALPASAGDGTDASAPTLLIRPHGAAPGEEHSGLRRALQLPTAPTQQDAAAGGGEQ